MIIKCFIIKLIIPLFFNNKNNKVEPIPHQRICEYIHINCHILSQKTHFDRRMGLVLLLNSLIVKKYYRYY